MANTQLRKLVDNSHKTYGRWKKQMQLEGFTKREELSIDSANYQKMSTTCKILWDDFQEDLEKVSSEITNPAQPVLQLEKPEKQRKPGLPIKNT